MKLNFLILSLTSSALISSLVWAQAPLSFEQCVDMVKANNADLRASQESLKSSRYQVDSNRGAYYPQLSANLGYAQAGPNDNTAGYIAGSSYSANISATQNLFNGFADVAKVDQAKAQARVSEASLQTTLAQISFDLKSAYASLIYSKDSVKISAEIQKRREDNLRMVELQFESGRENKGSLLLSQAYLKDAMLSSLKAKHARQTSEADLKKVLGLDSEAPLDIADSMPLHEPSTTEPSYDSLAIATPNRRQSQAQIDVSEASLTGAKSAFLPSLNLTGQVGKVDQEFYPNNDRWSVGATFSWPLFGGGRDYYATKSAAAQVYVAKSNLQTTERTLLSNLKKAFTAYEEAVEDLNVNEAYLQAAKVRAEIARSKYNNGLLTFDDWDIIENDLIAKQNAYVQSKRDRIIAEAAWEQAQGVGAISE